MVGYLYVKLVNNVRVGRVVGVVGELFFVGGVYGDWVVYGVFVVCIERFYVEDVDIFYFFENFEMFEISGLFEVGGNGIGFGIRVEKVVIVFDFCMILI